MDSVAAQVISQIQGNPRVHSLIEKIVQKHLGGGGGSSAIVEDLHPVNAPPGEAVIIPMDVLTAALTEAFHQGAIIGATGVVDAYCAIADDSASSPHHQLNAE